MTHYEVRAKYINCSGSGWLVYETTNYNAALNKFDKYKNDAKKKYPNIKVKLVKVSKEVIKR